MSAKLHNCQCCSVCNQDSHKSHMPLVFFRLKESLGNKLQSKGEVSFNVVVDDSWEDKDRIKRLFK